MLSRYRLRQQWSMSVEQGVILSLIISLVAISFSPIFIRISEGGISPYSTILNRFWIATVAISLWNWTSAILRPQPVPLPKRKPTSYSFKAIALLLSLGTLLSISLMLWAWSLTQTSVANSAIIHSLTPIFTALWGWLFLRRRIDQKFLIGMAIAVGGTLVIGFHDLFDTGSHLQGDLGALLSAALLGAYPWIVEQLKIKMSSKEIVQACSLVGMVVALPVVLLHGDRLLPDSIEAWFSVLCLAIICQIIGLGLGAKALKRFSAEFISTCHLLTPVLSSISAWIIFGEILSVDNWIGFSCVLGGIYITVLSRSAVKPQETVNSLALE